ncbi:MAG: hypothetical protein R3C16_06545 [Hyphomonadaceae bacterium]
MSAGVLLVGASPNAPLRATLWALAIGLCISSHSLVTALGARVTGNAVLYIGWNMALDVRADGGACLLSARPRRRSLVDARAAWRGISIGITALAGYGIVPWAQTFAPIAQVTKQRPPSYSGR